MIRFGKWRNRAKRPDDLPTADNERYDRTTEGVVYQVALKYIATDSWLYYTLTDPALKGLKVTEDMIDRVGDKIQQVICPRRATREEVIRRHLAYYGLSEQLDGNVIDIEAAPKPNRPEVLGSIAVKEAAA